MHVVALLTLPKAADYMPIAPAVSGNDQVEDRQLQRKLRISMLHGRPRRSSRLQAELHKNILSLHTRQPH